MFGKSRKKEKFREDMPINDVGKAIRASMYAMHIMALADGKVSPEEREAIIDITSSFKRGLMSPEEIFNLVDDTQQQFSKGGEESWEYLFNTMKPFHRDDLFFVMHSAFTFAILDDELHAREQRILSLLGLWMGMKKKDLRIFTSQVEQRLSEYRATGQNIVVDQRDWRIT